MWAQGPERPGVLSGRVSHRGNVSPATPGRVDGPAACEARRGPDGVRGVVDFCDPAKILDLPGRPPGDIPSRELPADRTPMTSLLTNGRKRKFHFPLYRQNELIKRVEKKCGEMFLTRNIADKIAVQSVREKHRQAQSASECIVGHFPPAGEGIKSSPAGQIWPTRSSVAD